MTSYTWQGISGDWDNANDWSPSGGPPTSSGFGDHPTARPPFTVNIGYADVANSLTISDANATINASFSDMLTVGSLTMSNGSVNVYP